MSLRKTVFDTAALSSVNILRLLVQFLAVPVLARILSPADYGVVAMAMPFVFFAMIITDAGIGISLVRTPTSERSTWSTCFWLSIGLGVVLTTLMAVSAPLAATLFGNPQLKPIVLGLSLVVLIQSFGAISGAALQQNQQFKVMAAIEIVTTGLGIGTAVLIAFNGGGAWALVGQQLVFYTMRMVLTVWVSPFRPVKLFDIHSVKEHISFSRDVLSVNIIGFFARSIDNLIIGKVLASAAVGIYAMTFQFARLPSMLVSGPLQYVLYAKLAHVKDNKYAIRQTFLALTRVLAIIIFPVMGMVAVAYHPIFDCLLSAKWAESGKLFMLVAPICALQAVTSLNATILLVLGHANIRLRTTIESGVLWIIALLISVSNGLDSVAIAFTSVGLLYAPRSLMLSLPMIECSVLSYVRTLIIPACVTSVCIAVYWLSQQLLLGGEVVQLSTAALLALFGVAASAVCQRRILVAELTGLPNLS
jgi:O-antigen/teichoic acid export membrane protein